MSAQLTIDCLSGIDWERPRLEQIEQFLADALPDKKIKQERHSSRQCVSVECKDGWKLYACPSLDRISDNALRWHVYVECVPPDGSGYWTYARRFHDGQEEDLRALVKAQA